jgi:hypothetical protein
MTLIILLGRDPVFCWINRLRCPSVPPSEPYVHLSMHTALPSNPLHEDQWTVLGERGFYCLSPLTGGKSCEHQRNREYSLEIRCTFSVS